MTLQEQARESGLVLLNEAEEWNETDWPPLKGGWRSRHASVVLHPPDNKDNDDNKDNKNKGQTVVVMGVSQSKGSTNSVLLLNLAEQDKQWRQGPPMNKKRMEHAAVVCNGGIYVIGGGDGYSSCFDCMERIDFNDLLQSFSPTRISSKKSHWTTLNLRLSTGRIACCAVAVQNRYIVVTGGWNRERLSSVEIIDTNKQIVTAGPCMNVPRQCCASAVIGHRIFVVGGRNDHGNGDSMEYLEFAKSCDNEETKEKTDSSAISFSSTWTTHAELMLSVPRGFYAAVALGSCLVVTGGRSPTVEVLDTHSKRVWNLPPLGNLLGRCSMLTLANQIALVGGRQNPACATLPLMDRNSWCFQRLCEQQPNGWYHSLEGMWIRNADISRFSTSTSARKRARPETHRGDEGKDET